MRLKIVSGIMLTLLSVSMLTTAFNVQPVKAESLPVHACKIGVIGPVGLPHWSPAGMKEGAEMARDEINAMGGIQFPEGNATIDLAFGNEYVLPVPDPEAAAAEVERLIDVEGCNIIIGGFRTETTAAMIEEAMDAQVPFIIIGAPTNELISNTVPANYTRYKYLFRTNPVNSTTLTKALWSFSQFVLGSKLLPLYGEYLWAGAPNEQVKVAVVSENLALWDATHENMTNASVYPYILGPYANVTYSARVSVNETDFSEVLGNVIAHEARLLIHLFSTQAGANFTKQWAESEVEALPVGINVEAQNIEFWEETEEKCEYETTLSFSGTRTPITPQTVVFWNNFYAKTGMWPTYTACGAYDTIHGLKDFVENTGISWANFTDPDKFADEYEDAPERTGLAGKFKFTSSHDVFCNEIGANWEEGYVRPFICQWYKSRRTGQARLEVVMPQDQIYSRKWRIPTWMYSLAETDLDYDGDVDLFDIFSYLAFAYLCRPGDLGWNPDCDIDGNGIVNMVDVAKCAKDYGKFVDLPLDMVGASAQTASPVTAITQTDSTTMVYLDLPTINGTEIGVNENVTVNLRISDAVNVTTWEAGIAFNPNLLECVDVNLGDFLEIGGATFMSSVGKINNTSGEITGSGCCVMQSPTKNYSASGDGTLAEITFRVKALNVSDLHLRDVVVIDLWGADDFILAPFNIIDVYTVTRSAARTVFTVSNSTGMDEVDFVWFGSGFYDHTFSPSDEEISFDVTGPHPGWSNVTVPKTLLNVSTSDKLLVIIDDNPLKTEERTVIENSTHYFVYFNYTLGIHSINILERPPVYNINANRYYTTIQEAIVSAESGHRILAYAGTHYGNVVVNKTVSLIGENKYNTTIDGSGVGTVINITVNNVNMSGFTIQNSGSEPYDSGVWLHYSSGNNNISHNIITNNWIGICLYGSSNNILADNNASNNEYGIAFGGSSNTLINNTVSNNEYGISLHFSSNSILTNNTMSCNKYNFGLYGAIETHFNNIIDESNTVDGKPIYYVKNASKTVYNSSTNAGTLYLINCTNITIKNLTLTKNVNGIFLWNTKNSTIQNVTTSKNLNGIHLQGQSNNNNLTTNTVSNNELGICLNSSNNSVIYHNSFVENTIQANITVSYKTDWDDGYPSGGNYWSDHSIISPFVWDEFKGENQDVQGNDGIIDDPKVIDQENQDNYPLVSPSTPPVYNLNTYLGYTTVKEAIDASNTSNGHTIVARAGTYSENVTISKSLTLIGIMGNTIINGTGTVVTITANSVTLRGFTIQGNSSTDEGIFLSQSNNTVIIENTITTKRYGIWLDKSHNCRISGNTLNNNTQGGIRLEFSDSAIISRNTLANNSYGIVLSYSSDNAICRNNVTDNAAVGIKLVSSNNNTIYRNNFIDNTEQVNLFESPNTWDDGGLDLCPVCGNPQPKGNYWSDYTGLDDGTPIQAHNCQGDGVGDTDTPHLGVDKYPLMSPRTPQHDVKVASVTPSQTVVASTCRTISITVTVENLGDYTEKFNVTAYYNETAIILPNGKNYTATTATIESSTIITFTWNAIGIPYGKYIITANATVVPGETDTADNAFEDGWIVVTKVGDVNGDGYVSGADIVNVLINLGPVPPKPPECDVNGDGVISGADIVITLINLG